MPPPEQPWGRKTGCCWQLRGRPLLRGRAAGPARLQDLLQHLVLGTKGDLLALFQHQQRIDGGKCAWPVCHHHNSRATLARVVHSLNQRSFAFGIQVGVGFIKNEQNRIAEHRPRQPDTLQLACRQAMAAIADPCVVAVRQANDHVVYRCLAGSLHDLVRFSLGLKPRDVVRNRAVEQFHLLWQVADMTPELIRVPLPDICTIELHLAANARPNPHQRARQGRLASTGWTYDAQACAGFHGKVDIVDDWLVAIGNERGQAFRAQLTGRLRQRHGFSRFRRLHHQHRQPVPGRPEIEKRLPVTNSLLNRRQRARHDDGGSNHRAWRNLLADRKPRPQRKDTGLEHQPQSARERRRKSATIGCKGLRVESLLLLRRPARPQGTGHAHHPRHLGIAQRLLGHGLCRHGCLLGLGGGLPDQPVVDKGQRRQEHHRDGRGNAKYRMQHVDHGQIDRRPRHVEKRKRTRPCQKLAQRDHVIDRAKPQLRVALQGMPLRDVECTIAKVLIRQPPNPHHQAGANELQKAVQRIKHANQHDKRDQRRHGTAGQHPVIDLQHEQRSGEHQQVRDKAEHAGGDQRRSPLGQRSANAPATLRA
jgi:hypothetical protein